MTNPTIYSGSERILRAGVFCTLLDLTLTIVERGLSVLGLSAKPDCTQSVPTRNHLDFVWVLVVA